MQISPLPRACDDVGRDVMMMLARIYIPTLLSGKNGISYGVSVPLLLPTTVRTKDNDDDDDDAAAFQTQLQIFGWRLW
jgi:hypothetical protein